MRHVHKTTSITIAAGYQFINCKTIRLSYSMSCVTSEKSRLQFIPLFFKCSHFSIVCKQWAWGHFNAEITSNAKMYEAAELMGGFVIEG